MAFLPKMLHVDQGHIVTVASSLGLCSSAGVEVSCHSFKKDNCASKFGAIGFHEPLSLELKETNTDEIKMTLVCPFLVDTGMFRGCGIREEISSFIPPLKMEYCVERAMRSILTDLPVVCTPRITFMKMVLPFDAIVCM